MINPLSVLFMLVTAVFNMSVQDDPVSAFADKVADARVRLEYSYLADDGGMKLSGKGIATVQDNCYHVSGDGFEIWCDGESVYTVDPAAMEAVIESVSSYEGQGFVANPVSIVRNIANEFSWTPQATDAYFQGCLTERYDLEPTDTSSGVGMLVLYFRPDDSSLYGVEVYTDSAKVTFTLSEVEFLAEGDMSEFNPPAFGQEYIVTDLR